MGSFKIEFKGVVEKEIRRMPRELISNVLDSIEKLSEEPVPHQAIKLMGVAATYRLRIGDYRIIYQVDKKSKTIVIHHIRHRREVYRGLS